MTSTVNCIAPNGRDPSGSFLYYSRTDVVSLLDEINVVDVVIEALIAHAEGRTELPAEAYLGWHNTDGNAARCLAMPGAVKSSGENIVGLKIINGSLGNVARGLTRSQGLTALFDPETARPVALMEAAAISATRTAGATVTALRSLNHNVETIGVVGCGTLAAAHLEILARHYPRVNEIILHDIDPNSAKQLALVSSGLFPNAHIRVADRARDAVEAASTVVLTTVVDEGYVASSWITPGTVVAHVSLDDLLPEVLESCDLLIVDDWKLCADDSRRILGRMAQQGLIRAPGSESGPGRAVDATIGDLLSGKHPGSRATSDIIVVNPFGMSILDVAVANQVHRLAMQRGLGIELPF